MFGQPETENLFLKRSDVIYDTTDNKNPSPEIAEFLLADVSSDDTLCSEQIYHLLWIICICLRRMMAQMRTYTQLIEYWLRVATTAVITPHTWPEKKLCDNSAITRLPPSW